MSRWSRRDLLLALLFAAVFGFLYGAWDLVWQAMAFANTIQPGLQELFYGFWFSAAIVGACRIRRPGAALLVQGVAVLVEMALRGRWGVTPFIGGLLQAGLAEGVFAWGRYKRYDSRTAMIAGAAAALGSLPFERVFLTPDTGWSVLAVTIAARTIGGASLAGWLGKTLAALADGAGARTRPATVRQNQD